MRYRMLPYNYTLAWENHTTGSPLARPMFFHYPDDANVHQLDDQYLWGENLLVAPVFEDSATSRKLYLPEGNWFDIRTAEKIKGSRFYTSEVEPYSIPVFAKGGAFLPLWMEADQTLRYAGDKFRVVWFADPEAGPSAYQLYQDDGHTPDAFAKGEYCLTSFSGTASESLIEVQVSATGEYSGMPATREITLEIPHVQEMPLKVKVNDKKAKLSSDMTSLDQETLVWDKGRKILLYRFMMDGTETSLRIEGNKLFGN
jgi:alpha-glucosidase (family GH31 glycosyl hydrolase)